MSSSFCDKIFDNDFNVKFHPSAVNFLKRLDLSPTLPHCFNETAINALNSWEQHHSLSPTHYHNGSEKNNNIYDISFLEQIVTIWFQVAPALLAMAELWLRLFAIVLAPLSLGYLLTKEMKYATKSSHNLPSSAILQTVKTETSHVIISILGLASCLVIFTDSMYVLEYGRRSGGYLFLIMVILTIRTCRHLVKFRKLVLSTTAIITCLTIYLLLHSENNDCVASSNNSIKCSPGIDVPSIKPGFYYSSNNSLSRRIASLWPEESRTYDIKSGATPYLPTGDSRTGIPFLVNKSPDQNYHRVWINSNHDQEAIALDIAFPTTGIHSNENPVYLILHGLNGGSHEEYVREFVSHRTQEGHTCIVMVARGLMDTPIVGWNLFHGARITDVETSAKAIHKALAPNQILAGVGYSMGAIILSNYVARSGPDCKLDTAVAVSGGLDMREMLNSKRSMRLWQPMLAQTLRDEFIVKKFDSRMRERLSQMQYKRLMRASSVSAIDQYAIVVYNGFNDLLHYYTEMSAMGDTTAFQKGNSSSKDYGRISSVSIPFLVLHSLDDPLTPWRTIGHNPERIVNSGAGNIFMLLTKGGGHVGWPIGMNPRINGWKWMNTVVRDFTNSVNIALLSKV